MGRRKLTKILMQNGAEPAIKNKVSVSSTWRAAIQDDLVGMRGMRSASDSEDESGSGSALSRAQVSHDEREARRQASIFN